MRTEPYTRDEHGEQYKMNLPPGMTCGDCVHMRRCAGIYGRIDSDEQCDWSPSNFQRREPPATEARDVCK